MIGWKLPNCHGIKGGWVCEWLLFNAKWAIFSYINERTWWDENDDEVRFALEQIVEPDVYGARSLIPQSANRHVAPLGHISFILIPSHSVLALPPKWCVLIGEARNTRFIVFSLTFRSGLELTIYRTWGKHANHYTVDAVHAIKKQLFYINWRALSIPFRHSISPATDANV